MRGSAHGAKCAKCSEYIQHGSNAVLALGNKFHEACFRCGQCGGSFTEGYVDFRGMPYHQDCCHNDQDSYSNVCAGCQKTIEGAITVAGENSYHSECFKCDHCNGIITKTFDIVDGKIYHPEHVPHGAIPDCTACRRPCDAKSVLVDGKFFHEACLACAACRRPLSESKQYVEVGGKMYHSPDCVPGGGTGPCPVCKNPLSNPAVEVDGQTMHNACFRCEKCRESFTSSYAKVGNAPPYKYYHEKCAP